MGKLISKEAVIGAALPFRTSSLHLLPAEDLLGRTGETTASQLWKTTLLAFQNIVKKNLQIEKLDLERLHLQENLSPAPEDFYQPGWYQFFTF